MGLAIFGHTDPWVQAPNPLHTAVQSLMYERAGNLASSDVEVRQSHINQIVGAAVRAVDDKITQLEKGAAVDRFEADRLKQFGSDPINVMLGPTIIQHVLGQQPGTSGNQTPTPQTPTQTTQQTPAQPSDTGTVNNSDQR